MARRPLSIFKIQLVICFFLFFMVLSCYADNTFKRELQPHYLQWVGCPGEHLSILDNLTDLDACKKRTGANATVAVLHRFIQKNIDGDNKWVLDTSDVDNNRKVALYIPLEKEAKAFQLQTKLFRCSKAIIEAKLCKIVSNGPLELFSSDFYELLISDKSQDIVITPDKPLGPGKYKLELTVEQGMIAVRYGQAGNKDYGFEFSEEKNVHKGFSLLGKTIFEDSSCENWLEKGSPETVEVLGEGIGSLVKKEQVFLGCYLGVFNNPYFSGAAQIFSQHPDAFMQNVDGEIIKVEGNPVLAVDSPVIYKINKDFVKEVCEALKDNPFLKFWVVGAEESWPDYFGTSQMGDFRPKSIKHFSSFLDFKKWEIKAEKKLITKKEYNPTKSAWCHYREQAMADRAACYMEQFLESDPCRPVFYPTHGNPFVDDKRQQLGMNTSLLAGVVDGLEMGQLTIDDDDENLNLLYLSNFSSFWIPTIIPRLGNKTLDPNATGGGRSFTPRMLRRLVYECIGMGAWHIGPIHWRSKLADGEWFIKGTPAEAEAKKVFKEIKDAHFLLTGMSRLQPKVGLYISDATWVQNWDPVWTDLFQQALADNWQITIVSDGIISEELASKMPVLISVNNSHVSQMTQKRFEEYIAAGGHVFALGDFAQFDELGHRSAKNILGEEIRGKIIEMDIQPADETKKLVNEFSTGQGAWARTHHFNPVPLEKIEKYILEYVPKSFLTPLNVQATTTNTNVNVYTLTDGSSLLAVIINRSSNKSVFYLKPEENLVEKNSSLKYYDVLAKQEIASQRGGTGKFTIEPYQVKLIWLYPDVSQKTINAEINKAEQAMLLWQEKKADTSFLAKIQQALSAPQSQKHVVDYKKYCLARLVTSSLCLKSEIEKAENGKLIAKAELYDSTGKLCSGANLTARIIPGVFRKMKFDEVEKGKYTQILNVNELSSFYNPENEEYQTMSPVRVIFDAYKGYNSGGSWQLVNLHKN